MLKVGITGGIGSGKSVVCRVFALLGIPVYDSDFRAKWVMQHDPVLRQGLIQTFGAKTYTEAGELDRAYLGQLVFKQPEQLAKLNSLVHPRVKEDFEVWSEAQGAVPYILKEAALMFESDAHKQVQKIITVSAPLPIRITRVLLRDPQRKEADIQSIIDKQISEEERQRRSDFIIYNDDEQLVIPQITKIHQEILSLRTA